MNAAACILVQMPTVLQRKPAAALGIVKTAIENSLLAYQKSSAVAD
jgi:hypothetical protein